jgi:hypothetical protein
MPSAVRSSRSSWTCCRRAKQTAAFGRDAVAVPAASHIGEPVRRELHSKGRLPVPPPPIQATTCSRLSRRPRTSGSAYPNSRAIFSPHAFCHSGLFRTGDPLRSLDSDGASRDDRRSRRKDDGRLSANSRCRSDETLRHVAGVSLRTPHAPCEVRSTNQGASGVGILLPFCVIRRVGQPMTLGNSFG